MTSKWKVIAKEKAGERQGSPRTVELVAGWLRLTVTRHIHAEPGDWLAFCGTLLHERRLTSTQLEDAKAEAITLLRGELVRALKDLPGVKSVEVVG